MRLYSLELNGFKSFPDKTYLKFDDGITAVVGPNGSGKSNIADAVRWVLGEQSTKTLRGGKMEDVIFSGTQDRRPVGYASVKLTIDNLSDSLSSDMPTDEGKITIGRRLYRSGESEYRINGSVVRLKDVHELFMDTGLGRDGYSIIGQGRIAEIVSAKSTQRREIFEEAAGIAKFRYHRTEAERRLSGAEENLIRLNDILGELEDRVGPLKIQSEKAQKYLKFAEERKELEISLWTESLGKLKEEITEQQSKVLVAKNDYQIAEASGEALENQINQVYREMQQKVVAADERRNSIKNLQEELSEGDSKIAVYNNDIQHNDQSIKRLEDQLKEADQSDHQLEAQLEVRQQERSALEEKLAELKIQADETKARMTVIIEEDIQLTEAVGGLNARKSSLEQAANQIQLEQAASQSLFSESRQRLDLLKEKDDEYDHAVEEHQANVQECEKQISQEKEHISSLENSRAGYALKRESRFRKFGEIQQYREDIQKNIDRALARKNLLEDMESNMEGYAGSVKFILNQSAKGVLGGVLGAVSSIISTDAKYIAAIETALGGAMQNLIVKDESAAKQCINSLKQSKVGRATFLPLTSVKGTPYNFSDLEQYEGFIGSASSLVKYDDKFSGIIYQLLGRICVVDDLDTGSMIAKDKGYRFRVVTLDGQVINAGGSYTGGTASRSAGVLGRRNEIEELARNAKAHSEELEQLLPELNNTRAELASIDATVTGASAEIQTANEELVRLGFSRDQLVRSLELAEENRRLARQELENLAQRLDQLTDGKITAGQLIEDNLTQITQLTGELDQLGRRQTSLREESQIAQKRLSRLQLDRLGVDKDCQSVVEELERLQLQASSADLLTKRIGEELSGLSSSSLAIAESVKALVERKDALKAEIEIHNKSITEAMEARTVLEQRATQLRQQEREQSTNREDISRELVRLEERQINTQGEYDGIIAKLWDEYELTRSMAVELARPLEDFAKASTRLTQLRNQIRGLGSVNLEAVEEYKEVGERYEFLSVQIKDVEDSKAQLKRMIKDLTSDMETIFDDNFTKISKEFSIVFSELFSGGKGELVLTDGDDILETGIEINVQPPGKVIKNLSLLSGGEQAFVAIAIYFAILKVKPAPFVVLDEIEAALDDVNVLKYASYLRTLSHDTQFIAITHRRGTMEEADVLYGVTMQEEGVSKLLELNINEVESKLGMEAE